MRAYVMSSAERSRVKKVAHEYINQQGNDIAKRVQYLWMLAMLQAGLSPRTVNRVLAIVPEVSAKYAEYRTDQIADFACAYKLREAGVNAEDTTIQL